MQAGSAGAEVAGGQGSNKAVGRPALPHGPAGLPVPAPEMGQVKKEIC